MDLLALEHVLVQAEAGALAARCRRRGQRVEPAPAQLLGDLRQQSQGHMHDRAALDRRPARVRNAGHRALGLPSGARAPAAPSPVEVLAAVFAHRALLTFFSTIAPRRAAAPAALRRARATARRAGGALAPSWRPRPLAASAGDPSRSPAPPIRPDRC